MSDQGSQIQLREDIPMPVHLWHGGLDNSTPLAMARTMAAAIPDCRARVLPDEAHFLLFTHWPEILSTCVS